MSSFVEIDTKSVDEMLKTLSDTEQVNEILCLGLDKMADVYYQNILQSLRKEMGAAADTVGINGKYNYTLSSGIEKHIDKANTTYGVHALKDFRLTFFEGGTKRRYTKGHKITGYTNSRRLKRSGKGGYRGFITANNFFTKGISSAEQNALEVLESTIINAIKNKGIDIS